MSVFSPSSTASWTACPIKFLLHREGWRAKYAGKADLSKMAGSAWAVGSACLRRGEGVWDAKFEAASFGASRLAYEREYGIVYPPQAEYDLIAALDTAIPGVHAKGTSQGYLYAPDWEVVAVEQPLGEEKCRPDLICRTPQGLVVVDDKFSLFCKPEWVQSRLEEHVGSPQLYHYVWRAEEFYGEQIDWFWICFVIAAPAFQIRWEAYRVSRERLEQWRSSAHVKWQVMNAMSGGLGPAWEGEHVTKYGKCDYHSFCLTYGRDRELALAEYVNVNTPKEG